MSFIADYEVIENACPSKFTIKDKSTGNETPTGRSIILYRTDLVPVEYEFPDGEDELLVEGEPKDYVYTGDYTVIVASPQEGSTYTKSHDFVNRGYSKKAKYDRSIALEIDETIIDKAKFMKDSNVIEYYFNDALTFVSNGNLVDSQKALDNIKELTGYSQNDC